MSTCTKRVMTLLEELEVPYELVTVDFKNQGHKSPAHKKMQPFGKIPVLEDSDLGVPLFESRSILRYLANKYQDKAGHLLGVGTKERALVDNWLEAEAQNFGPCSGGLVKQKVFAPMFGQTADEEKVKEYTQELEGVLDAFETILSSRPYLAGEHYSLADIAASPYLALLPAAGASNLIDSRPAVKAWADRILNRPVWKQVFAKK
eukprot:jgi/Astpho2/2280/Aster-03251